MSVSMCPSDMFYMIRLRTGKQRSRTEICCWMESRSLEGLGKIFMGPCRVPCIRGSPRKVKGKAEMMDTRQQAEQKQQYLRKPADQKCRDPRKHRCLGLGTLALAYGKALSPPKGCWPQSTGHCQAPGI